MPRNSRTDLNDKIKRLQALVAKQAKELHRYENAAVIDKTANQDAINADLTEELNIAYQQVRDLNRQLNLWERKYAALEKTINTENDL
jgi:glutamine synthetase adenylyltransferase